MPPREAQALRGISAFCPDNQYDRGCERPHDVRHYAASHHGSTRPVWRWGAKVGVEPDGHAGINPRAAAGTSYQRGAAEAPPARWKPQQPMLQPRVDPVGTGRLRRGDDGIRWELALRLVRRFQHVGAKLNHADRRTSRPKGQGLRARCSPLPRSSPGSAPPRSRLHSPAVMTRAWDASCTVSIEISAARLGVTPTLPQRARPHPTRRSVFARFSGALGSRRSGSWWSHRPDTATAPVRPRDARR